MIRVFYEIVMFARVFLQVIQLIHAIESRIVDVLPFGGPEGVPSCMAGRHFLQKILRQKTLPERCVAVGQVQKLAVKADLIIWCVSEPRLQPHMAVEVRGWNSIADVEAAPRRLTGPATGRKVDNRQIDEAVIRVLEDLRSYGRR